MEANCISCLVLPIRKILLLVLLSFSCWLSGLAQNMLREITEYNSKNFREELFIQTDRDWYIVGEQVWFKVYKLNAYSKKPDNVSKAVYIELLNSTGYPVIQIKLNVDRDSESSSFILSDTLSSGNYLLRAYTNWMKNYSEKDFSFKPISIINPFHRPEKIGISPTTLLIDTVHFYPEGGSLVSGIESRVGFMAINKSGGPQKIDAALVNGNSDTLCLVQSEETGFGTFLFTPDHRDNYKLIYINKIGEERGFPLGMIERSGIALSLDHSDQHSPTRVKINIGSGFHPNGNSYFIFIISEGLVKFIKEFKLNKEIGLVINGNELPKGISQIILSNNDLEQLSNRWIYNEFEDNISLDVKLDKQSYGSREKVKVEIISTDKEGDPVSTDLSVSITKSCTVNTNRVNINNRYKHLSLLRMGINSYEVADINDYLLSYSDDNFDLMKIMNPDKIHPQYLPDLEGIILSGTLRDSNTDEPLGNTKVVFSLVGRAAKCQLYETNYSVDFHFVINESGLQEIVIQPVNNVLSDYHVELKSDFSNSFDHFLPGSFCLDTSRLEELNNSIINMQIENIYKPYRQNRLSVPVSDSMVSFYGEPMYTVDISEFIRLTTVDEVIKEIVPYVHTRKMDEESLIRVVSDIEGKAFDNNPLVLVDGIPFNDFDQLLDLSSTEMERIEVINRRYFIDNYVFDGIVHFVTKKGNLEALDFDHAIFRQAYKTFYRGARFNSPDYSNDSLINSPLPDFRNTLYWNPDLQTQNDGVVSFEFFTSDEAGDYTMFIEGNSPDGETGVICEQLIVR